MPGPGGISNLGFIAKSITFSGTKKAKKSQEKKLYFFSIQPLLKKFNAKKKSDEQVR